MCFNPVCRQKADERTTVCKNRDHTYQPDSSMTDSQDPSLAIKQFHQNLIIQFRDSLTIHSDELDEDDKRFTDLLDVLCSDINTYQDEQPAGQKFVSIMISRYPQLTPQLPRDLLWYFAGDCLHYVEDKELEQFQALEEAFYAQASKGEATAHHYSLLRESFFAPTPIKT